ncbi:hypothetical protein SCHPADRAFT_937175 [Schizopora paradoxa]|uniref:Uncharacterized protein n=1 Tax=Schizopora paradoxa TaxID=27342 RepID=A0A0H2S6J1_9AGAM|nr:hypothetical protein SCHPADRAFT_937175 [Schizopora paradoxa]
MAPRKPSKADMKKYNVEAHIERKVMLLQMCEDELDVLRADPEGSDAAIRKLKSENVCLEGDLPFGQEMARGYLEKCERLVAQPANSHEDVIRGQGLRSPSLWKC